MDETKMEATFGAVTGGQTCPCGMSVAMMYVPIQDWETPYDDATALMRGTIFPALDKPFTGEGAWAK